MQDNTQRFSKRAIDYAASRPGYPAILLDLLKSETCFSKDSVIADIGSGTGISAEIFLKNGNTVFCIEPNKEMRTVAETAFKSYPNFRSLEGRAESTGLDRSSVDIVLAAQAFHWFDRDKAKIEFKRILKSGGYAVLVWNERKRTGRPFYIDYENLILKYALDYTGIRHWETGDNIFDEFFGDEGYHFNSLKNSQFLDLEGLKKRVMSTSYLPAAGEPGNVEMIIELELLFSKYKENGRVCLEYDTKVYIGKL